MQKFNRVYLMKVEGDDGTSLTSLAEPFRSNHAEAADKMITITLPYTVEFRIVRRQLTSSQSGNFKIYNLGKNVRDAIQKDIFQRSQYRRIEFYAGYDSPDGKFVPLVFNGTVLTAFSYRVDRNWVTEIEAYDGMWQRVNGNNVSLSLAPNTSTRDVLFQLATSLPNLTGQPLIGQFPTTSPRGQVLFGNAWDLLVQQSQGLAFIDSNQLKVLNWNEFITSDLETLSWENGLLGAPKRTETMLEFDMIFEPRLTVGQILNLNSLTQPIYNHDWKVMGFEHRGTISPSVAGECLTSVSLWFTQRQFNRRVGT